MYQDRQINTRNVASTFQTKRGGFSEAARIETQTEVVTREEAAVRIPV